MPTVSNKTQRPLSVPLPSGKTLHLGPGKTGQITARAVDDPRLKKLIDDGEIELVDERARPSAGPGAGARRRSSNAGHTSGSGIRRSGDR